MPEVGSAPDLIADDLPANMDYLDESYGAAAGLREMDDNDLDDFGDTFTPNVDEGDPTIILRVGGETVRVLQSSGLSTTENHFNILPAIPEEIPQ
jgi:autophagy-related protein 2